RSRAVCRCRPVSDTIHRQDRRRFELRKQIAAACVRKVMIDYLDRSFISQRRTDSLQRGLVQEILQNRCAIGTSAWILNCCPDLAGQLIAGILVEGDAVDVANTKATVLETISERALRRAFVVL